MRYRYGCAVVVAAAGAVSAIKALAYGAESPWAGALFLLFLAAMMSVVASQTDHRPYRVAENIMIGAMTAFVVAIVLTQSA